MFGFFRRKKTCIHRWHLIDTTTIASGSGIDGEDKYFIVACPHCDIQKFIPEREYSDFEEMFNVKAPS